MSVFSTGGFGGTSFNSGGFSGGSLVVDDPVLDSSTPISAPGYTLDDTSGSTTTTTNPSLSSPLSSVGSTSPAALNTVAANPTVYSSGSSGAVQEISAASSAIGQWGYALGDLLGLGEPSSTTNISTGAGGSAPASQATNPNTTYILFAIAAVVIILIIAEMD